MLSDPVALFTLAEDYGGLKADLSQRGAEIRNSLLCPGSTHLKIAPITMRTVFFLVKSS